MTKPQAVSSCGQAVLRIRRATARPRQLSCRPSGAARDGCHFEGCHSAAAPRSSPRRAASEAGRKGATRRPPARAAAAAAPAVCLRPGLACRWGRIGAPHCRGLPRRSAATGPAVASAACLAAWLAALARPAATTQLRARAYGGPQVVEAPQRGRCEWSGRAGSRAGAAAAAPTS